MLGGLTHVPAFEGAPQPIVDHGVHDLLIAILPTRARSQKQMRRAAHALHAPGHQEVRVAGLDGLGSEHDRLQARAAHLVDRYRGDRIRKASLESRLAGGILPDAGLQDVAHDDFIDLGCRYPRALDGLCNGHRA